MEMLQDTIIAPATPPIGTSRAIVRVSGPKAHLALCALASSEVDGIGRRVWRGVLRTSLGACPGMLVLFDAPRTATGEDTGELHLPGNPWLVDAVVNDLTATHGCRMAEPGEFTRRAYMNGRIDLLQAEAVMALITASSSGSAKLAAGVLDGAWSRTLSGVMQQLELLCARMELSFDFDEEAAEQAGESRFAAELARLRAALSPLLTGPVASSGLPVVVLAGAPNAGKSTLFNALSSRRIAAVSEEAGTTRDAVTAEVELAGVKLLLVDTAGRSGVGLGLEAEADRAAADWLERANLIIECSETDNDGTEDDTVLRVRTKADTSDSIGGLCVSAHSGIGIQELKKEISSRLAGTSASEPTAVPARLRRLVTEADSALGEASDANTPPEVTSAMCRQALSALRDAMGQGASADVLDAVFGNFCVGK